METIKPIETFIQGIKQPMVFLVGAPDNIGYVMMKPGRFGSKNDTFRFDRIRSKKAVEAAVFVARDARFGKDEKG